MPNPSQNVFLHGPMARLFAKTALPIIFVMLMNGMLNVADAVFLGRFVGDAALAAVTLVFPLFMLLVAVSSLVSAGMSSVLARLLGGGHADAARSLFGSAHWLAIAVGLLIAILYLLFGQSFVMLTAKGDADLATMAATYLGILFHTSPIMFVLGVNVDALRNEGHVGVMAGLSVLVSVSNVALDYVFIAQMGYGVAGSAWGTVLAQVIALVLVLAFRFRKGTTLTLGAVFGRVSFGYWRDILALGAPQSLSFVGLALSSSAILAALQIAGSADYATTVSAYGIITRITTMSFLPLMGLAQAMQTITGNNAGAGQWDRVGKSFGFALTAAIIYCLGVELIAIGFARPIGSLFVADGPVVAEVGRIMPIMLALYAVGGPISLISGHFQALGDAPRAAVTGLTKPYLFYIPLVFLFGLFAGEKAIWWASPGSDLLMIALVCVVLWISARKSGLRWGLFRAGAPGRAH